MRARNGVDDDLRPANLIVTQHGRDPFGAVSGKHAAGGKASALVERQARITTLINALAANPAVREGALAAVEPAEAFSQAAQAVKGARLVGVGSSRASVETKFALRELVGAKNCFLGVSDSRFALMKSMLDVLRDGPTPSASLREDGSSDAVIVLGEDVWNTAPILALTLRQAAVNVPVAVAIKQKRINRWEDTALREAIHEKKGPFFVATVEPTELDTVAAETVRAALGRSRTWGLPWRTRSTALPPT